MIMMIIIMINTNNMVLHMLNTLPHILSFIILVISKINMIPPSL